MVIVVESNSEGKNTQQLHALITADPAGGGVNGWLLFSLHLGCTIVHVNMYSAVFQQFLLQQEVVEIVTGMKEPYLINSAIKSLRHTTKAMVL